MVHKVSASTGREERAPGFPVRITLLPLTEKDASPLNVANGYLYAVTSGYNGDAPPYDGHVVAVDLSTGRTTIFNSLCSKYRKLVTAHTCATQRSGIWGRGGAVVDPDSSMNGRIYAATGNGQFDAAHGGDNYGDTLCRSAPTFRACSEVTRLPITSNSRKATPIWEARRRGFCRIRL